MVMAMVVLNATFNNISVISWWLVLLVEEIGVPGENHRGYNLLKYIRQSMLKLKTHSGFHDLFRF
jgi:hypothetical protein